MTLDIDKDGMLDATPLRFGQYKGKTPDEISELGKKAQQYLVWAYETVGNFDVCSAAMYRDCGGKGKRAEKKKQSTGYSGKNAAAEQGEDRYESRGSSNANRDTTGSLDLDDDIPF